MAAEVWLEPLSMIRWTRDLAWIAVLSSMLISTVPAGRSEMDDQSGLGVGLMIGGPDTECPQ